MKTIRLLFMAILMAGTCTGAFSQDDEKETKRNRSRGTHSNFKIDLGMNNYLENGESPGDNNELYSVRPWGSWYVGLNSIYDTHIKGAFHLEWGGGVSWYNFKFEDESVRLAEGPDAVIFSQDPDGLDYTKSKLTAAYVNVSAVPMFKFGTKNRNDHWFRWKKDNFDIKWRRKGGFRIGAGMYAGYRIASYTKYVVEEDGDKEKDKDRDGFFLNNLRYGARMQLGFRGLDLFFNYDLNELFSDNKGPELNAFSFGVVL